MGTCVTALEGTADDPHSGINWVPRQYRKSALLLFTRYFYAVLTLVISHFQGDVDAPLGKQMVLLPSTAT